jgi:protein AbiQ
MILKLKLVKIDSKYCDYLRKFDEKVPYNKNEKELRPFVGILFKIKEYDYFAPLTSPKPKHLSMKNTMDFMKIDDGKLGAVNFNNMIPVQANNYEIIEFSKNKLSTAELKYQELLKNQLSWLNSNIFQVKNKSYKLYEFYINGKLNQNIKKRCCNFILLEEKSKQYNK